MPTFTLHYQDDGVGLDKRVEFDGSCPGAALGVARNERPGRQATLLVDGAPLCRLGQTDHGLWIVAMADRPHTEKSQT